MLVRWLRSRVADFPLELSILSATDWINPEELSGAAAAVIQVESDNAGSIKRFQKLAGAVSTPLIAACYEPPLALVRSLIRAGAHDVIPLPLSPDELEAALAPIREELDKRERLAATANAKLVSIIKSVGGVGATALAEPAGYPLCPTGSISRARRMSDRSRRSVRRCGLSAGPAPETVS